MAILIRDGCPTCGSTPAKQKGHIHQGKQSDCCKDGGRPFVAALDPAQQAEVVERLAALGIERIHD